MFDRHARRGLKGVRALREALERWDPASRPTESEMETLLVQALRAQRPAGARRPVRRARRSTGRFVARVDAAYPDARHRDRVRQQAGALRRVSGCTRRSTAEQASQATGLRRHDGTSRRSARSAAPRSATRSARSCAAERANWRESEPPAAAQLTPVREDGGLGGEADGLGLEVLLEAGDAVLAAVAALLVAAER